MAEHKKTGRPSKGVRDSGILAKPPEAFGKLLRAKADALGLSYGDYLVLLASQQLGMPEYAPTQTRDRVNEIRDFRALEATTAAA